MGLPALVLGHHQGRYIPQKRAEMGMVLYEYVRQYEQEHGTKVGFLTKPLQSLNSNRVTMDNFWMAEESKEKVSLEDLVDHMEEYIADFDAFRYDQMLDCVDNIALGHWPIQLPITIYDKMRSLIQEIHKPPQKHSLLDCIGAFSYNTLVGAQDPAVQKKEGGRNAVRHTYASCIDEMSAGAIVLGMGAYFGLEALFGLGALFIGESLIRAARAYRSGEPQKCHMLGVFAPLGWTLYRGYKNLKEKRCLIQEDKKLSPS